MKKNITKYILTGLVLFTACSTQKNTLMTRTYHGLTSHYNIYFNGNESFKSGISRVEKGFQDDFSRLLPLFYYQDESVSTTVSSDMDRAIEKAVKVISLHSITVKPDLKKGIQTEKQKAFFKRKEYNKWIDENYVLMGKAYVYKNQYRVAIETLRKMISDFPEQDTRFEAMIWLARAFIMLEDYPEADRLLMALEAEEELPEEYLADLYITYADFNIRQDNAEQAIPYMKKALSRIKSRHYKIRYTYILAQLCQESDQPDDAIAYYQKVIRMNPPYEMTFNAKINMAGSFRAGNNQGDEIRELLKKMLKDDKNIDFRDQIYYALGDLSLKENDLDAAIANYKLSVEQSTGNYNQKGLSYLALGDIYYEMPEYILSQAYYDSSLQNISKEYEYYDQLSLKGNSLNKLVRHSVVYEMEDSLQNLALLPEDELFGVIDKIIEEVIRKEEEEKLKQKEEMLDQQYGLSMSNNTQNTANTQTGGAWYFYNMNAKSFGQPEFRMKWGNRKLEDNWRRRNKQSIEIFDSSGEGEASDSASSESARVLSNKNREFYMQDIPFSDSAFAESGERLKVALFNMGLVYRKDLLDDNEAIIAFKEVIERFPEDEYALLSAYNLYEIYDLTGNIADRNFYKDWLLRNFPDSPRAKILANPEYVEQMTIEQNRVNVLYEETYTLFQLRKDEEVVRNVDYALVEFEGHKILPKYRLLKAISKGRILGNTVMTAELDSVIADYPGTEESEYARNLIESIYQESPETEMEDTRLKAEEIYHRDSAGVFYAGMAVKDKDLVNQLRFNVINFNLDNFNRLNLGILSEEFGDYSIVFVTSFDKLFMVQRYLDACKTDEGNVFRDIDPAGLTIFHITEKNYKILKEDQDFRKYKLFFESNYK